MFRISWKDVVIILEIDDIIFYDQPSWNIFHMIILPLSSDDEDEHDGERQDEDEDEDEDEEAEVA